MPGTSGFSPSILEMIRARARRSPESSCFTSSFSLTRTTLLHASHIYLHIYLPEGPEHDKLPPLVRCQTPAISVTTQRKTATSLGSGTAPTPATRKNRLRREPLPNCPVSAYPKPSLPAAKTPGLRSAP